MALAAPLLLVYGTAFVHMFCLRANGLWVCQMFKLHGWGLALLAREWIMGLQTV